METKFVWHTSFLLFFFLGQSWFVWVTRYVISVFIKVFVSVFAFPMRMLHWSSGLEHLHQCSACDPGLGIVDEVHQSNPANPLEEFWEMLSTWTCSGDLRWGSSVQSSESTRRLIMGPPKYTAFQRALEESSKHSRIVLVDCSLCFWLGR